MQGKNIKNVKKPPIEVYGDKRLIKGHKPPFSQPQKGKGELKTKTPISER